MKFVEYRNDPWSLDTMVIGRLAETDANREDIVAIWRLLAPLALKGEEGYFHREHCLRVGLLAEEIARHEGEDRRACLFAGLLHDVGKALVPRSTLGATCRWTTEDRAHMERHVDDGWRLLRDRFDFTALVVAGHHADQARGYPSPLPPPLHDYSAETIAKADRCRKVLVLADVFDALHRVNSTTEGAALDPVAVRERLEKARPGEADRIVRLYRAEVLR